ncbi:hypothetical protein [Wolbachia endosymbiont of Ctenocephalides felis wCfeJ]|uniref:hypothetical protein n=1 Tax=Wolbachia endosymbiont of Ctenocephalides felis wCfeJ TaxID=2732594 RepID=UPI0014453922|nr:hypothetical protein [Wolbachia endosymbiont of Ctenocephalides felis wCfeJ]WCR58123.1 MAG: hypothetical protein PG980_000595 [Wolbachia endosymbiont of Ctenocephalides felis wCfeJ]
MALTNYQYKKGDSVFHSISKGYNQAEDFWGIPGAIGGLGEYTRNNKWKTAAVVGVVVAVPLIAAYILSPVYAGFVNTTTQSAYAGMITGGKGLYALAVTNPVFTGLLAAAIVGTIGALIYMNYSKANQIREQANQIDGVKKAVLEACEKDDQSNPNLQDKKIKIAGKNDPLQVLTNVAVKLGLVQVQTQATA